MWKCSKELLQTYINDKWLNDTFLAPHQWPTYEFTITGIIGYFGGRGHFCSVKRLPELFIIFCTHMEVGYNGNYIRQFLGKFQSSRWKTKVVAGLSKLWHLWKWSKFWRKIDTKTAFLSIWVRFWALNFSQQPWQAYHAGLWWYNVFGNE